MPWGDGGLSTLFHSVADPAERAWRCGDLFWWRAAGERDVCLDRTWPLSAAARAHRDIEEGNTQGKGLLLP